MFIVIETTPLGVERVFACKDRKEVHDALEEILTDAGYKSLDEANMSDDTNVSIWEDIDGEFEEVGEQFSRIRA